MIIEDEHNILTYLKKHGPINTFRLATELGIDRHKILNIIKDLERKKAIEFKTGKVKFLKFPVIGEKVAKKPVKVKKALSRPKKKIVHKVKKVTRRKIELKVLEDLQNENKMLKERLSELEGKMDKVKKVRHRKRRKIELKVLEDLQNENNMLKERLSELEGKITHIEDLEKTIKELQEKEKPSKFDISWIKNIRQLETPEFIDKKISAGKTNFARLNKNIKQLHVPEILRNPTDFWYAKNA